MSDINYKVRYINQYDQIVREVPKTGTLGDTVSITPNQLGYGFETIVADPKSLELTADEGSNIVEFKVMQTVNDLTVGNHYLDKRLSRTEIKINGYDTRLDKIDMLIDKNQIVDPDTVLWEGDTMTGQSEVQFIDVLAPDLSNLKNGVKLELGFKLIHPGGSNYIYTFSPLRLWNLSLTMTLTKAQMLSNAKITITPEIVDDDTKTYQLIKGQKLNSMVGISAHFRDDATYPGWIVGGGSTGSSITPELSFHYGDDSAFRKFKSNYYINRVIAY